MKKEIKELQDFYLLDGKLLYVSREFIGYNPIVGKGLSFKPMKDSSTETSHDAFELGGSSFGVTLTSNREYGPIRGFRRTEIWKDGKKIINYEWGGMGHGSNYYKGKEFVLVGDDAFLLKRGHALRNNATDKMLATFRGDHEYLFWFKGIVVPTEGKTWPTDGSPLRNDKIYHRADIEPLKQVQWEAHLSINGEHLHIRKVAVPFCSQTLWQPKDNYAEFRRTDQRGYAALDDVEFIWE